MPLVRLLYSEEVACTRGTGIVGGHFHLALDEHNCKTEHVQFGLDAARAENCALCIEIGEKMLRMSWTQRRKLANEKYFNARFDFPKRSIEERLHKTQ